MYQILESVESISSAVRVSGADDRVEKPQGNQSKVMLCNYIEDSDGMQSSEQGSRTTRGVRKSPS